MRKDGWNCEREGNEEREIKDKGKNARKTFLKNERES